MSVNAKLQRLGYLLCDDPVLVAWNKMDSGAGGATKVPAPKGVKAHPAKWKPVELMVYRYAAECAACPQWDYNVEADEFTPAPKGEAGDFVEIDGHIVMWCGACPRAQAAEGCFCA